MKLDTILLNLGRFVLLFAIQLMILNQVVLTNLIIPYIYVLFILMLPTGMNRIALLLISFFTGLCMDMLNSLIGFHTFACTLVALARILIGDRILMRDNEKTIERTSYRSTSFQSYSIYSIFLLLIFYISLFCLELFSFHGIFYTITCILLSTTASWLIMMLYQTLFIRKEH
ncbi:MAG: hypothetical protein KBT04_08025 [Bacteroidales bacterium]|nr:hypothetical protein [Candidatus Colimorpha onthohippi]